MDGQPDAETLKQLEKAVLSLRRKEREIFLAHRLDDMTYAEIAERTGLSVEQVTQYMARALYKIGQWMDRQQRPWWRRWL